MNQQIKKLFEISAGWNSLLGKFSKDELLSVNVVVTTDTWGKKSFQVQVTNRAGQIVNRILNSSLTMKTAVVWAEGTFGHEKVAS